VACPVVFLSLFPLDTICNGEPATSTQLWRLFLAHANIELYLRGAWVGRRQTEAA
jgi:hypothetical protein